MKTIQLYISGAAHTFETLSKGKFLFYFVPGLVVSIFLWVYYYEMSGYREAAKDTQDWFLIGGAVSWILEFLGSMLTFLIEQLYMFIVLVCFSPFNCMLSEKYDNYITGNKFDGGFIRILNDLLRAIFIVILAVIMEYVFIFVYWIVSGLIPDALGQYIDPVMYFLIPSFFIGFAFFDYSLERYGEGTFSSWGYAFKRMLAMLVAGSLFTLLFKIPYVGIILAPVFLTMLSTYVFVHREDKLKTQIVENELLDQND